MLASSVEEIRAKVLAGARVTTGEARWLWANATDAELRELANLVRGRFHFAGECTYMIMRIVNYTNVCVAQCDYCAFYRLPGKEGGYVMSTEQVFAKLDELLELGGIWRRSTVGSTRRCRSITTVICLPRCGLAMATSWSFMR